MGTILSNWVGPQLKNGVSHLNEVQEKQSSSWCKNYAAETKTDKTSWEKIEMSGDKKSPPNQKSVAVFGKLSDLCECGLPRFLLLLLLSPVLKIFFRLPQPPERVDPFAKK